MVLTPIIAGNNRILNWWSEAYSHIYSANDIIKGVENSNALTVGEKNVFKGQALLVRAYMHSLLAALYGDIPYVTTTDYLTNNIISRTPVSEAYDHIIQDLSNAGTITLHYAYKYKANLNETESLEYSILLRSAELYLIRAEARAHLGEINGAQQDVNSIRNRAGLPNTEANTINDLLSAILQERRIEFFTEHGHRWFDLKRTGLATETLQDQKLNWQPTDILFPVPESEIEVNPNLLPQNNGYQ